MNAAGSPWPQDLIGGSGLLARATKLLCLSWLLLLGTSVREGQPYPGGVPDVACLDMLPTGHGVGPMTSDPPFKLFVSKKRYKPGETLQVVAQAEGEDFFRGLMVQARMTGCNVTENRVVGTFTNTDTELETKHCFGEIHSTVSHNSATKKRLKTIYWTAPVISSGHIVMRATFLREFQEFWVNVESEVVADLHSQVTSRCLPGLPPPTPTEGTVSRTSPAGGSTAPTTGFRAPGTEETLVPEQQSAQSRDPSLGNTSDEGYPSWLGPSFEKKPQPEPKPGDHGDPSWLIPAYQRASASDAVGSKCVTSVYVKIFSLLIVHQLWILR